MDQVRKCLTVGMFIQIAKKVGEVVKNSRSEYRTMVGNKTAAIHPASVLFQKKPYPEAIVYTISFLFCCWILHWKELVYTTKDYFRGVTAIEANWISELVPEWFSSQHSSYCVCNKYSLTNNDFLLFRSGFGFLRNSDVENPILALGFYCVHVGAFGEIEFMRVFFQGSRTFSFIWRAEPFGCDGDLVSHGIH